MSDFVEWIAAQANEPRRGASGGLSWPTEDGRTRSAPPQNTAPWQEMPTHNFLPGLSGARQHRDTVDRNPDLWLYRSRTVALLRRYMRLSLETGHLPSIVGKEFFRATMTSYHSVTFEDRVIFVRDVEKILSGLADWDQQLIARIILQEHSHDKAARILHCCRRTIQRRVPEVLDLLSEDFLEVGLLVALPSKGEGR